MPTRVPPIPTTTVLFALLGESRVSGASAAALLGDPVARLSCVDYLEEEEQNMVPFAVGEKHLIQTETLYWVGEIVEVAAGFLVLDSASWVHWTGRLSALAAAKTFTAKKWPAGARKPRTEYVGRVLVSLSKIVASIPGDWTLPLESVTA